MTSVARRIGLTVAMLALVAGTGGQASAEMVLGSLTGISSEGYTNLLDRPADWIDTTGGAISVQISLDTGALAEYQATGVPISGLVIEMYGPGGRDYIYGFYGGINRFDVSLQGNVISMNVAIYPDISFLSLSGSGTVMDGTIVNFTGHAFAGLPMYYWGGDVSSPTTTPVPEPPTMVLGAIGAGVLGAGYWRGRRWT